MPSNALSLQFEDLLTQAGLARLKDLANQVINDSSINADLVFAHFKDKVSGLSLCLPVDISKVAGQINIEWKKTMPGIFDFIGFPALLSELKISISEAGDSLRNMQMEFESELDAFIDKATQQAARMPLKITIADDGDSRLFKVEQNKNIPSPELTFGGLEARLQNSYLSFTIQSISEFELDVEVVFPDMADAEGNSPYVASMRFVHQNKRFAVHATNLPIASINGFKIRIDSLFMDINEGAIQDGSNAEGVIVLGFLDHDASGPAEIHVQLIFGENGMITCKALNPDGHALRKGPVLLRFNNITIITMPGNTPDADISGVFGLEGVNKPDGTPAETEFAMTFAEEIYRFEGLNFIPLPIGFGTIGLSRAKLHIAAPTGNVLLSEWIGKFTFLWFDQGSLDFEIAFDQGTGTLQVIVENPDSLPLHHGDISLVINAFSITYVNGEINDITGNGQLMLPLIQVDQPMEAGFLYSKQEIGDTLTIRVNDFHSPQLAGSQLSFSKAEINFVNNSFLGMQFEGRLSLPVITSGEGIGFKMDIIQNGQELYFALDPETGPHVMYFGPVEILFNSLEIRIQSKEISVFTGSGIMSLPGFNIPMGFHISIDQSGETPRYIMLVQGADVSIGEISIYFNQMRLLSEEPDFSVNAEGNVRFPVFNNQPLSFNLDVGSDENRYGFNVSGTGVSLNAGPVIISNPVFNIEIVNGSVSNLTGQAGFSMEGLDNVNGERAVLDVLFGYNSTDRFTIALNTDPDNPFDIVIGGFAFRISTLSLAFSTSSLQYPFAFSGGLILPGLQDEHAGPAMVDLTIQVDSAHNFRAITNSNNVFVFGNLKVSDISVEIQKEMDRFNLVVTGKLTIEGMGGESRQIDVDIDIVNDGSFAIRGEVTPAMKVLDVPSMVSIYLSMIELSRRNNNWGFAMGGVIHNRLVIPGMEALLPDEVLLRNLNVGTGIDLDMRLSWPSGLSIDLGSGSSNEEIRIPVNGRFGNAITLDAMKLAYGDFSADQVPVTIGFSGAAIRMGPVSAAIEGLGLKLVVNKMEDPMNHPGNFGVVDIDLEFMPPQGLGVSLNTSVFTGGGYLFYDKARGEYAGAVELSLKGLFQVSAIGLINSKMPDGKPGTSVLFIMAVSFPAPGIALGFGFFINGLGGIIGIHRTIMTDKLRDGVKSGTVKNLLFPVNIVENIPAIINDIKEVFPIKRDQFIIGPLAIITWGVPTIMRIDIGLAIEFANPVRFGILGVLRVALPSAKVALVKLNVAFLGLIDFEKKMLSFDASLFDSKILTYGLEGDMALRLSWGDRKDFLLSMGGFHPSYTPPAYLMIPAMKRMTVKILTGNPRITLSSYFAITTNTVQFGASLDFLFKVSKFKVVGEFGYDVLFQFSPFRFIADAYARLAVKAGSKSLLSISLDFSLEGPTPWRAKGTAKFKILFIKVKVKFDKTWGEQHQTRLEDIYIYPLLLEACEDDMNWRSVSGAHGDAGVRLKGVDPDDGLLLTPDGFIELTQKIVPLKAPVKRFGQYKPKDFDRFEIISPLIGNTGAQDADMFDFFAPASFLPLTDQEKLKAPSFERQASGVRFGSSSGIKTGAGVNRTVKYQEIINDREFLEIREPANYNILQPNEVAFMVTHGAMARSPFSRRKNLFVNPSNVKVKDPDYVLINADTLEQVGGSYSGYMQAYEAMQTGAQNLQIIAKENE